MVIFQAGFARMASALGGTGPPGGGDTPPPDGGASATAAGQGGGPPPGGRANQGSASLGSPPKKGMNERMFTFFQRINTVCVDLSSTFAYTIKKEDVLKLAKEDLGINGRDVVDLQIHPIRKYVFFKFVSEEVMSRVERKLDKWVYSNTYKTHLTGWKCDKRSTEVKIFGVSPDKSDFDIVAVMSQFGDVKQGIVRGKLFGNEWGHVTDGSVKVRIENYNTGSANDKYPKLPPFIVFEEEGEIWKLSCDQIEECCWKCLMPGHIGRYCNAYNSNNYVNRAKKNLKGGRGRDVHADETGGLQKRREDEKKRNEQSRRDKEDKERQEKLQKEKGGARADVSEPNAEGITPATPVGDETPVSTDPVDPFDKAMQERKKKEVEKNQAVNSVDTSAGTAVDSTGEASTEVPNPDSSVKLSRKVVEAPKFSPETSESDNDLQTEREWQSQGRKRRARSHSPGESKKLVKPSSSDSRKALQEKAKSVQKKANADLKQ